eukprot:COSAG04_NODE_1251_length_7575_cov_2.487426_7_plen_201_part_00
MRTDEPRVPDLVAPVVRLRQGEADLPDPEDVAGVVGAEDVVAILEQRGRDAARGAAAQRHAGSELSGRRREGQGWSGAARCALQGRPLAGWLLGGRRRALLVVAGALAAARGWVRAPAAPGCRSSGPEQRAGARETSSARSSRSGERTLAPVLKTKPSRAPWNEWAAWKSVIPGAQLRPQLGQLRTRTQGRPKDTVGRPD